MYMKIFILKMVELLKLVLGDLILLLLFLTLGVNEHDLLLKEPQVTTGDTNFLLSHLDACEDYLFQVRLVGPLGYGPFSNVAIGSTEFGKFLKLNVIMHLYTACQYAYLLSFMSGFSTVVFLRFMF